MQNTFYLYIIYFNMLFILKFIIAGGVQNCAILSGMDRGKLALGVHMRAWRCILVRVFALNSNRLSVNYGGVNKVRFCTQCIGVRRGRHPGSLGDIAVRSGFGLRKISGVT